MVKGISRQVIVVQSPDPKLFEQAIFILNENVEAVSDAALLKEAEELIRSGGSRKNRLILYGSVWACAGAFLMGAVWLLTFLF